MAVSSAGLRPKSDCSDKAQKQFYSKLRTRPLVREGATKITNAQLDILSGRNEEQHKSRGYLLQFEEQHKSRGIPASVLNVASLQPRYNKHVSCCLVRLKDYVHLKIHLIGSRTTRPSGL
jgi:hypothetical protein